MMNENNIQIWKCGEEAPNDVIAVLEDTTLTIIGNGKMCNYRSGAPQPDSFREITKSLIIKNGVSSIGSFAFNAFKFITSVAIPSSITNIGSKAFYNCTSLESVILSEGIVEIGDGAFDFCKSLKSIVVPDSVTKVGLDAFRACHALTTVVLGKGVESIGNFAFKWTPSLKEITNLNPTPQRIEDTRTSYGRRCPFEEYAFKEIFLYVPLQSVELYRNHAVWKRFEQIIPIKN